MYIHARATQCNSGNSMEFLDIKDPAKRTALVDEYVKAMKTVRRRNMVNHDMKLATFIQMSVRLSKLLKRHQESWYL